MEEPQRFHEWLAEHQRGVLDDEVTAGLAELVQHVTDTKVKGAKLLLEVTVEPGDSTARTVLIGGTVTVKLPKAKPALGVRYVGAGGTLHKDDPYQTRITDARTVDAGTGEIAEGTQDA